MSSVALNDNASLRIEARFKNGRLYDAIKAVSVPFSENKQAQATHEAGPVKKFCELYGLSYSMVSALLNLRIGPYRTGKASVARPRPICQKLAEILDSSVEDLFPRELYAVQWPRLATYVEPIRMLPLLSAPRRLLTIDQHQEDSIANDELRGAVLAQLKSLTEREEKVIKLRYGLDGSERDLGEVGTELGVSKTRVRQIEQKALRKLRHPSRSLKLLPFVNGQSEWKDCIKAQILAKPCLKKAAIPGEYGYGTQNTPPVTYAKRTPAKPQPQSVDRTTTRSHSGEKLKWQRHLCIDDASIRRGWWPQPEVMAPPDAIEPEVTRLIVPTNPPPAAGVLITIEGFAYKRLSY